MVLSKRIKVSQAQADDFVRTYFLACVIDCYEAAAAAAGEFPDNFLTMNDVYRDYISRGFRIEVTYDQFVRALRALRPRRCFVSKYGQIIIGHRLGKSDIVNTEASAEEQQTTTVV